MSLSIHGITGKTFLGTLEHLVQVPARCPRITPALPPRFAGLPQGEGWQAALQLRDAARQQIPARLDKPDATG